MAGVMRERCPARRIAGGIAGLLLALSLTSGLAADARLLGGSKPMSGRGAVALHAVLTSQQVNSKPKKKTPLTKTQAARAYLLAVAPVSTASLTFTKDTTKWTSATTGPDAAAQALPLIRADATSRTKILRTKWPTKLAADIHRLVTTGDKVTSDLKALAAPTPPKLGTWEKKYLEDSALLTSAANTVRHKLGLSRVR
jgi:hypothetical protein